MRITDLASNWEFRQSDSFQDYYRPCVIGLGWLPAEVPGCVHLDLVRNGVIADPFTNLHEHGCQWVDEAEWEYRTSFLYELNESFGSYGLNGSRQVLRFEGLDTFSTIYLNGKEIGKSENMFVPMEIDVTGRLIEGTNELEIRFSSAVRVGMKRRSQYFEIEGLIPETTFFDERAFVRKAQYMSGWDWGPRLVSCGIWQPVRLLEFETRILSFTVLQQRLEDGSFRVWSETFIEGNGELITSWDGKEFRGEFDLIVEDSRLWWPNGHGEQHLYTAHASVAGQETISKQIGLRTIELKQVDDEWGRSFEFVVNQKPIFAIGGNWIPNDSFPSRIDPTEVAQQILECADLGMNMIRVWGGGFYESEAYYDACDKHGILVWQDFPFACSYYPDDPAFLSQVEEEVRLQIERLRDRTCLALWCGNNEIQTMWEGKWGKPEHQPNRWHGQKVFTELLPNLLSELDPNRDYVESSPIGSDPAETPNCNGDNFGDQHFWEVWHSKGDWIHYRDSGARFCSEFGFASSCSMQCWESVLPDAKEATPEHPVVRSHDKTNKPWDVFRSLVELHYPHSESLADWIQWSQFNQLDAMREAIEHFRFSKKCAGALVWQINDCWPVQSWSLQDYSRKWKRAGKEMKRLCHPVLIGVRVRDGLIFVAVDSWLDLDEYEVTVQFAETAVGRTINVQKLTFNRDEVNQGTWKEAVAMKLETKGICVHTCWEDDMFTWSSRQV
jgi:beta-mannosidase